MPQVNRKTGRFCNFSLLLYNEDTYYDSVLKVLNEDCSFGAIVHDNDLLEDGSSEKVHTHVVLRFKDARSISSLASFLGVPDRLIQPLTRNGDQRTDSDDRLDLVTFYRYMIHNTPKCRANRLHWSEYSVAEVFGTLAPEIERYNSSDLNSDADSALAQQIMSYITSNDGYVSVSDLTAYCLANGLWSSFRRGFAVWSKVLSDHNYFISPEARNL